VINSNRTDQRPVITVPIKQGFHERKIGEPVKPNMTINDIKRGKRGFQSNLDGGYAGKLNHRRKAHGFQLKCGIGQPVHLTAKLNTALEKETFPMIIHEIVSLDFVSLERTVDFFHQQVKISSSFSDQAIDIL
jgi:hypothetical protein